jgi:hypothetical protein
MPRRKPTPEELQRRAEREKLLTEVHQAIEEGRAWLDTAFGPHEVVGYNDASGNAHSYPIGVHRSPYNLSTFMVCLDSILLQGKPESGGHK